MTLIELARKAKMNPVDCGIALDRVNQINWTELDLRELIFAGYHDQPDLRKNAVSELEKRINLISGLEGDDSLASYFNSMKSCFPELMNLLEKRIEPFVVAAIKAATKGEDLARMHNYVWVGSRTSKMLEEKKEGLINNVLFQKFERRIAKGDFAISEKEFDWLLSNDGERLMGDKFFNAFAENISKMTFEELMRCEHAVHHSIKPAFLDRLFEVATFEQLVYNYSDFCPFREDKIKYALALIEKAKVFEDLYMIPSELTVFMEVREALAKKAISFVREPAQVALLITKYDVDQKTIIDILRQFKTTPTPKG